ncbi:MAG: hypothetical protein JEY94_17220 [Melioribacteraceae bacterium]|nr:hypothetical protein [Melioribacteraceae bacterium]
MGIIKQNPFRILGLTSEATERGIQKQIGIIKRYAEIGKSKTFDYDFNSLGEISRNLEDLQTAASKIEQAEKKILHALFWFINQNQYDEIAFNNLINSNYEKAIDVWEKTLRGEVSQKNFSSYQNLSTLYLALSTINGSLNVEQLEKGIELKGRLLFSENVKYLFEEVCGSNSLLNPKALNQGFIDEVINLIKPYTEGTNGFSTKQILPLFDSYPSNIKKYLQDYFTSTPLSIIENEIEKTIEIRKKAPHNADKFVKILYKVAKPEIVKLKTIIGIEHVQYKMIINKLANEIMQCSIEYYNYHIENSTEIEPYKKALKMAKLAKSLKPTGQEEARINDALNNLEDMRYREIHEVVEFIKGINEAFDKVNEENKSLTNIAMGRISYLKEDIIIEMTNQLLNDHIIKKIAHSDRDELINTFFNELKKILKNISKSNVEIFRKLMSNFIVFLPVTNNIKYQIKKSRFEKDLERLNNDLLKAKNKKMYVAKIEALESQKLKINIWKFIKTRKKRERQLAEVQQRIDSLKRKGLEEKKNNIEQIEKFILDIKERIEELEKIYSEHILVKENVNKYEEGEIF